MDNKDEWRVRKFDTDGSMIELADWLNSIEREPTTSYFFLEKLLPYDDNHVLAVVCITKIQDQL